MIDRYDIIPPEEMDAKDAFEKATTHIQVDDIEGGKKLLREARDLLSTCDSYEAKKLAKQVQNLLNQYGG